MQHSANPVIITVEQEAAMKKLDQYLDDLKKIAYQLENEKYSGLERVKVDESVYKEVRREMSFPSAAEVKACETSEKLFQTISVPIKYYLLKYKNCMLQNVEQKGIDIPNIPKPFSDLMRYCRTLKQNSLPFLGYDTDKIAEQTLMKAEYALILRFNEVLLNNTGDYILNTLDQLIEKGLDVNYQMCGHTMPFAYYACWSGHVNVLQKLLALKKEKSHSWMTEAQLYNQTHESHIEVAVKRGHAKVVKFLLDNDCDAQVDVAKALNLELSKVNKNNEIVKMLVAKLAKMNSEIILSILDTFLKNPELFKSLLQLREEFDSLLVETINSQKEYDWVIWDILLKIYGKEKISQHRLANGETLLTSRISAKLDCNSLISKLDLNVPNSKGQTPLMCALATWSDTKDVKDVFLPRLDSIDLAQCDTEGRTALDYWMDIEKARSEHYDKNAPARRIAEIIGRERSPAFYRKEPVYYETGLEYSGCMDSAMIKLLTPKKSIPPKEFKNTNGNGVSSLGLHAETKRSALPSAVSSLAPPKRAQGQ